MKCISRVNCQVRLDNGHIKTFSPGSVFDFKECPPHFESLEDEDYKIDFDTASEAELMETEFDLDALKSYITEKYGKRAGKRGIHKTIDMLMDCRYRAVDVGTLM